MPPFFIQSLSNGTSRWQCGHQCATNIISCGEPGGLIVTAGPSNGLPVIVGIVMPTAGSFAGSASVGSAVPLTVTGCTCCRPLVSAALLSLLLLDSAIAMIAAIATTPITTAGTSQRGLLGSCALRT